VPSSRVRPDGYELKWLLSLSIGDHRGVAPFLIQDITPRDERIPRQVEHKNGITGIASLTVAVTELSTISYWYETVLGTAGQPFEDRRLRAEGLRFTIGEHVSEFVMPAGPESPLSDWLKLYGPSPYAATLRSPTLPSTVFDSRFTHGANLFVL